jgi:hypothetical protein
MKTGIVILVSLLSLALFAGCYVLVFFALHEYMSLSKYTHETLGNYDEIMLQSKMIGVPAFIVAAATMVLGPVSLIKSRSSILVWFWRVYGVALLIFSIALIIVAVRMTRSSTGEGAGLIIFITGPIILFALLIPTVLGTITLVAARKPRRANQAAEPTRPSGTPPADAGDRASGARGSL